MTSDSIKGENSFSRGLGSRPPACLSTWTWMYLGRLLHASLQPPARRPTPVRMPETVFIFLSFLSPAEEGARADARSADDGWAIAPRRRRRPAAGRAPPCRLHLARSMVPLTERAAAPPQNGALASCSVSALTDSVALEWQRVTANSRNGHLEEPLHQLRSRKNLRSVTKRRHIITSKWLKMQECFLKKGFYRCND